jgi:hypothetical protein
MQCDSSNDIKAILLKEDSEILNFIEKGEGMRLRSGRVLQGGRGLRSGRGLQGGRKTRKTNNIHIGGEKEAFIDGLSAILASSSIALATIKCFPILVSTLFDDYILGRSVSSLCPSGIITIMGNEIGISRAWSGLVNIYQGQTCESIQAQHNNAWVQSISIMVPIFFLTSIHSYGACKIFWKTVIKSILNVVLTVKKPITRDDIFHAQLSEIVSKLKEENERLKANEKLKSNESILVEVTGLINNIITKIETDEEVKSLVEQVIINAQMELEEEEKEENPVTKKRKINGGKLIKVIRTNKRRTNKSRTNKRRTNKSRTNKRRTNKH